MNSAPKPNTTNSELDEILRWQTSAVIEAFVTGKDPKNIKVTEEILNRHKEQAKARLEALIASKVEEARLSEIGKFVQMLNKHNPNNTMAGMYMELNNRSAELQSREQDKV